MNRIKQLRLEKSMSQVALAMSLHTTQASVSKYELEKAVPDLNFVMQLSHFFNVSTDYLLGLSPTRNEDALISEPERRLLLEFSRLSSQQKALVMAYIRGLNDNKG